MKYEVKIDLSLELKIEKENVEAVRKEVERLIQKMLYSDKCLDGVLYYDDVTIEEE